jgi:Pentapeptide repeats (8 copies)
VASQRVFYCTESERIRREDIGAKQDEGSLPPEPPADIQAVLHVLGRRKEDRVPEEHRVRIDLRATNLRGANLERANLKRVILAEANLSGATLWGANLREAKLSRANLSEALVWGYVTRKTDLRQANLTGADLTGANLNNVGLTGADLTGAEPFAQAELELAFGNKDTKLPEGLEPPKSWTQGEGKQAEQNQQE